MDELAQKLIGAVDFDPEALRARYARERDKRLRSDANDQYVEATADFADYLDDPFAPPGSAREPVFDDVEVAIIGAGFGGLLSGAHLREAGVGSIRLIDRASDVGGTWYWNRYPGVQCDVESYIYMPLLEELGYVPQHRYSFGAEILEHCRRIARHYGLYEEALFGTGVSDLRWDEAAARWILSTDRGDRMRARFVVMATGPISRPKLPGIRGIEQFRGHTFHTSRWDYRYTGGDASGNLTGLRDKRVGIIGTGATAIQCVPHLGRFARQLCVFQRTPSSVDVRENRPTDREWLASLEPGWQKRRTKNFDAIIAGLDPGVDVVGDRWTDVFRKLIGADARLGRNLSPGERESLLELCDFQKMEEIRARVERVVRDPVTAERLKPWYRQYCKRPCFNDEYLETFNRENVVLVDTGGRGVERITQGAVVANGVGYELDCLIFATGFEVGTGYTRRAGYDAVGRGGIALSQKWARGPRTFHGLQAHGFPNCFMLGFMQSGITFNVTHALGEQARHLAYIVAEARRRGARAVEATAEAERAWAEEMRARAGQDTEYYRACTPGYYNSEGDLDNPYGVNQLRYGAGPDRFFELLEEWRSDGRLQGLELSASPGGGPQGAQLGGAERSSQYLKPTRTP
jgi:cyclohexanone monooxygenase